MTTIPSFFNKEEQACPPVSLAGWVFQLFKTEHIENKNCPTNYISNALGQSFSCSQNHSVTKMVFKGSLTPQYWVSTLSFLLKSHSPVKPRVCSWKSRPSS
jgi:hypothetical protein